MRVTFLGHVGMFIETDGGSILCDPWFSPAYFGSWFPFPRNDTLDVEPVRSPDYLYLSHLHHDHFDPEWLRTHVDRRATVLLPAFRVGHLERELRALGFGNVVATDHGEPVDLGAGLEITILAMTAPADGPAGDSALIVKDSSAALLDQNDARPRDLVELESHGPFDAHFAQFSGAIWYPMVYDFPPEEMERLGRRKRIDQMERALHYFRDVGAPHLFPVAGPPCFLDDDLWACNDLDDDPANIFPDQRVCLEALDAAGLPSGHLLVPGSIATITHAGCTVVHPVGEQAPDAIFADKRAYLERYRADWSDWLAREKASWPRHRYDVPAELRAWFEPLLEMAPYTRKGVGGGVLLHLGDEGVLIDFPAGEVRTWDEANDDPPVHRIDVDRALVESLVERHIEDWVNELFLSCRFRAHREGPYNEYVYTFFKCLSVERMAYCEGYYASLEEPVDESFRCGDYLVQKRCPHLRADLSRFGTVEDGILECKVHHWRFELATGRCLTSDDEEHHLRTERIDADANG
ncbi:MAG: Rieske 2Fe-2S domain-containing protein [Acidimicrobiia bacterium]